jgi:tetratricopeptide (TPR) repeat protein
MPNSDLEAKKHQLERRLGRLRQRAQQYETLAVGQGVSGWFGQWASKGAQENVAEIERQIAAIDADLADERGRRLAARDEGDDRSEPAFESSSEILPLNPLTMRNTAQVTHIDPQSSELGRIDIRLFTPRVYDPEQRPTEIEQELVRALQASNESHDAARPHFERASELSNRGTAIAHLFAGLLAEDDDQRIERLTRVTSSPVVIGGLVRNLADQAEDPELEMDWLASRLGARANLYVGLGEQARLAMPASNWSAGIVAATAYFDTGRKDDGLQLLADLGQFTLGNPQAAAVRCAYLAEAGSWDEILTELGGVSVDPAGPHGKGSIYLALLKAQALEGQGLDDAAATLYADILSHERELKGLVWLKETRYRRGKLYLRGGRKAQARKEFARLAADDPHYRDVAELQREPGLARSRADSAREPIPQEVKDRVWRRDEGRCVSCGSSELLEFDHIIPLAMGGSNTERNLQLLCEPCNRDKAAAL